MYTNFWLKFYSNQLIYILKKGSDYEYHLFMKQKIVLSFSVYETIVPWGGTQKAFKSLDESPGSNEPGFLVRDLWYSWLISGKSWTSVYFHQSQSRKKELGLLKKTIPVAGFLLDFVSETQIIHLSFILLFSKCPFSKGSFCIKSICKNNFLYLFHANMYAIHTFTSIL